MYVEPYSAGTIGDEITIYGGFFPDEENRVRFEGLGTIADLKSADNNTITFKIPKHMETWCSQTGECEEHVKDTEPGVYQMTVRNKNGRSNPINFTIIPGKANPVIDSVTPDSGPVGTTITIKGKHFTTTGNMIHFTEAGDIFELYSYDGETLVFNMPGATLLRCTQRAACKPNPRTIIPAVYQLAVWNARGHSDTFEFKVTK